MLPSTSFAKAPNYRSRRDPLLQRSELHLAAQIKVAESAAQYQPSPEYAALPDFESFGAYASHARKDTLDEFRKTDLPKSKREFVYPWGAAEGFLLDELRPNWREEYFKRPFSLDSLFEK